MNRAGQLKNSSDDQTNPFCYFKTFREISRLAVTSHGRVRFGAGNGHCSPRDERKQSPHPSRSFRPQRISAPRYSGVNPPIALGMAIGSCSHQDFAPTRTTTPPSSVSVYFDSGRSGLNCGAIHFQQVIEKANSFECVSIWVKGG